MANTPDGPNELGRGSGPTGRAGGAPFHPDIPRRVIDIPARGGSRSAAPGGAELPSEPAAGEARQRRRLHIGAEISLSGEISQCDHLVVEGHIEATIKDCQIIEVAAGTGTYKGSADVKEADIGGRFDGDLTVRGRLTVRSTGIIAGTIRYGEIAVEAGGKLVGTTEPLDEVVKPFQEAPAGGGSVSRSAASPSLGPLDGDDA